MMKPWLHFTMGDNLFFMGWVPLSSGAVAGACIGLFMLAIIERWVAAMRCLMQAYWSRKFVHAYILFHSPLHPIDIYSILRTQELLSARFTKLSDESSVSADKKRHGTNGEEDTDVESLPVNRTPAGHRPHLDRSAPFIAAHDVARGAMFAAQAALGYALMLAVM
jgi:solute carrier family 31 (copper transporter), member 1